MIPLDRISRRDQITAIADDQRLALLRLMMDEPKTLTQLAEVMGTYPAQVRHHVKRLEQVGLIQLVRSVKTGGYTEKYYQATAAAYSVHLMVVPERGASESVIIPHCDAALEALTRLVDRDERHEYAPVNVGSLDGLVALKQGLAHIAGSHLLDASTGEYNTPFIRHLFPGRQMMLVTLAHREQGLVVREGNPLVIASLEDLARPGVRFVNRESDSGTRVWLEGQLAASQVPRDSIVGYADVVNTHAAVAEAVASGKADVGIATLTTALAAGLGFVPLFQERYDLVLDTERCEDPQIARLLDTLTTRGFRDRARMLGGYDVTCTGDVIKVG